MCQMSIKKIFAVVSLLILVGVGVVILLMSRPVAAPPPAQQASDLSLKEGPGFNKQLYSLDDPASPWVIVNKQRPLEPKNYKPSGLIAPVASQRVPGNESMKIRSESAKYLEKMFADAANQGLILEISSAYRSFSFQTSLYNDYLKKMGQTEADKQSARPGYSEHQTGLAVDIQPVGGKCHLEECFAELPEGKWLLKNSYKYGFILRYSKEKQSVTGYVYEPWHFRYVGIELAKEVYDGKMPALEEFFGLGPAPNYN